MLVCVRYTYKGGRRLDADNDDLCVITVCRSVFNAEVARVWPGTEHYPDDGRIPSDYLLERVPQDPSPRAAWMADQFKYGDSGAFARWIVPESCKKGKETMVPAGPIQHHVVMSRIEM